MKLSFACSTVLVASSLLLVGRSAAFVTTPRAPRNPVTATTSADAPLHVTVLDASRRRQDSGGEVSSQNNKKKNWKTKFASLALGGLFVTSGILGLPNFSFAETATKYDGFAEYAKENQMEQSDVGCFVSKCGDQTKALFSNPRGIKGVSCLGRCKGEQSCATRCFAEFGSESLNDWLSCTIEENECVKVPKDIDNSAEEIGYSTVVKNFDPKSLVGSWYKTDGLNPNYDLFDCQTNTFKLTAQNELDMGIFFRVKRPVETGGGFWENALTEHMVVDAATPVEAQPVAQDANDMNPVGRTMHTGGKMYGLQFSENWYILGESDGSGSVPPFKLVAYKVRVLKFDARF